MTASISLNFRSIGVSDRRGVGGRGDAEREIACELDRDPFCEPIGENPGELVISWIGYGDWFREWIRDCLLNISRLRQNDKMSHFKIEQI